MVESFGNAITGVTMKTIPALAIAAIVIVVIAAAIGISVWMYKRKKWNLELKVVLLRNNSEQQFLGKAKGYWDAENGWIVVKRKGYKKVPTQPIDPKEWLQGLNQATIIQVGPQDYIISREKYSIVTDSVTGKPMAVAEVIADVGKRKTWKNYTERTSKKAFTLMGWMDEHWKAIELAIVIFCMFLGFTILWMRMPSICQ